MPAMIQRMGSLGMEPSSVPGAEFQARIKADIEAYRKIADTAGIVPE